MTRIVYSVFAAYLLLLATTFSEARVGIGTSTPNSKAQLEVHSTTKGFYPPDEQYPKRCHSISSGEYCSKGWLILSIEVS